MDWLVRLGGDEWSLQGLSEALPTVPRIWKDDDGDYYLSAPALSACVDDKGAWREAELTVARINDAAALEPGHRPVVTQAVVQVGDDGSRRASVRVTVGTGHLVAAGARVSATVTRADGTVDPSGPSRLEQLYRELEKEGDQSELAYTLKMWRSGPRDWRVLYNVYESIKYDVSRGTNDYKALEAVVPRGMTWPELDNELERFRDTANNRRYSGLAARHGKPWAERMENPMSERDAMDLIRRLLETWINTKI
jgi:hypothetical protein